MDKEDSLKFYSLDCPLTFPLVTEVLFCILSVSLWVQGIPPKSQKESTQTKPAFEFSTEGSSSKIAVHAEFWGSAGFLYVPSILVKFRPQKNFVFSTGAGLGLYTPLSVSCLVGKGDHNLELLFGLGLPYLYEETWSPIVEGGIGYALWPLAGGFSLRAMAYIQYVPEDSNTGLTAFAGSESDNCPCIVPYDVIDWPFIPGLSLGYSF
jgi:hypothetical protein